MCQKGNNSIMLFNAFNINYLYKNKYKIIFFYYGFFVRLETAIIWWKRKCSTKYYKNVSKIFENETAEKT